MLLDGMHLPLTTPFFPDGRLNLRKLEQNVGRYSLTPATGMVVLGPGSEAALLTDREKCEVLRVAMTAASATKTMLGGVAYQGVRAALERIEEAAALGYDAVVLDAPRAAALTAKEREGYFTEVADWSALPLVLAGEVPVEWLAKLAFHPRVLGCMGDFAPEAVRILLERTTAVKRTVTVTATFGAVTGRMAVAPAVGEGMVSAASLTGGGTAVASAPARAAVRTRTKAVGFQVLMGATDRMLPGLLAGAVGAVPPFAVAAPQGCHEVLAAWKDGDPALAEEKQIRLMDAARLVEGKLGVAGLKYGCDLNGYFGGLPRLPHLPLLGEQKALVETIMSALRS